MPGIATFLNIVFIGISWTLPNTPVEFINVPNKKKFLQLPRERQQALLRQVGTMLLVVALGPNIMFSVIQVMIYAVAQGWMKMLNAMPLLAIPAIILLVLVGWTIRISRNIKRESERLGEAGQRLTGRVSPNPAAGSNSDRSPAAAQSRVLLRIRARRTERARRRSAARRTGGLSHPPVRRQPARMCRSASQRWQRRPEPRCARTASSADTCTGDMRAPGCRRPDRQQGEPQRAEDLPDLLKVWAPGGIAREEDRPAARLDHKSLPERAITIAKPPAWTCVARAPP